jgi:MFS family permease
MIPEARRSIRAEITDHFDAAMAAVITNGGGRDQAARDALKALGPAGQAWRRYRRRHLTEGEWARLDRLARGVAEMKKLTSRRLQAWAWSWVAFIAFVFIGARLGFHASALASLLISAGSSAPAIYLLVMGFFSVRSTRCAVWTVGCNRSSFAVMFLFGPAFNGFSNESFRSAMDVAWGVIAFVLFASLLFAIPMEWTLIPWRKYRAAVARGEITPRADLPVDMEKKFNLGA